jgi:hypothetical protein
MTSPHTPRRADIKNNIKSEIRRRETESWNNNNNVNGTQYITYIIITQLHHDNIMPPSLHTSLYIISNKHTTHPTEGKTRQEGNASKQASTYIPMWTHWLRRWSVSHRTRQKRAWPQAAGCSSETPEGTTPTKRRRHRQAETERQIRTDTDRHRHRDR